MVSPLSESKHVACARCRDRKVKCDGEKPGCKRCHRNGTACRYVRGKKQQTRSEWLQHLRTFSSQPGRTDVTRNHSRRSSQPALPQTPRPQPHHLVDNFAPYARSPSPYLFEHTAIPKVCEEGAQANTNQTSTENWGSNAAWMPSSIGYGCIDPQAFYFEPSSSFCNTNPGSTILTLANGQPQLPVYPAMVRSHTPSSHASETTSSYDGFPDMPIAYEAAASSMPVLPDAMTWTTPTTYEACAGTHAFTDYSSPY